MTKGVPHLLRLGLALVLLGLSLGACVNCEASGSNSRGSGMCDLTQGF